jgi:hypothetical protein
MHFIFCDCYDYEGGEIGRRRRRRRVLSMHPRKLSPTHPTHHHHHHHHPLQYIFFWNKRVGIDKVFRVPSFPESNRSISPHSPYHLPSSSPHIPIPKTKKVAIITILYWVQRLLHSSPSISTKTYVQMKVQVIALLLVCGGKANLLARAT